MVNQPNSTLSADSAGTNQTLRSLSTKPKLLLVADLGTLKAYRLEFTILQTPRLEEQETTVLAEGHAKLTALVTDLAGRRAAPTQKNWGAPLGDDHNLLLENRRRLINHLATQIENAVRQSDCPICWFAAPKEIARQIVDELTPFVRHRIKRLVPCDLTKATPKELVSQFLNPNFWTVPT